MGMRPSRMPKLTRFSRILIGVALAVAALFLLSPQFTDAYVNWLWFGGFVFVIGTMVAVWPDVEADRRAIGRQALADGRARQYA